MGDADLPVVLLVEDHHDTRQMYAMFMDGRYRVLEAASGAEALAMMRATHPDAVVTDLALPDVNGLELLSAMRGDSALENIPVLCLTGYGDSDNTGRRAKEAGFTRLLQKPCLPDTLLDALDEVLANLGPDRQKT